jgi:probable HAF family extracellular repeat protein
MVRQRMLALVVIGLVSIANASAGATMTDLGTLGGSESSAAAINERGQIVGGAQASDGEWHAVLWEPGSGMLDLGTLGGRESFASGIKDRGEVVGWSQTPSGKAHAFLWADRGTPTDPTGR